MYILPIDVDYDGAMIQLEELREQVEGVKTESDKLILDYTQTDNATDESYITLLQAVPEELSYIGYTLKILFFLI